MSRAVLGPKTAFQRLEPVHFQGAGESHSRLP
jgi:hypothetical protein